MSNLFKGILKRNLKNIYKEKNLIKKIEDDIPPMEGIFSYRPYDPKKGIGHWLAPPHFVKNELTNLAKSSFIRAMAQGLSPWIGTIDASDLRIARMRFGNNTDASYPDASSGWKLYYYDLAEISSLETNGPNVGGGSGSGPLGNEVAASVAKSFTNTNTTYIVTDGNDKYINLSTIYTEISGLNNGRPPSHETLVVHLYDGDPEAAGSLVESVTFANTVYTRGTTGNDPTSWTNEGAATTGSAGDTKLYWDATTGSEGWKAFIEINTPGAYSYFKVEFKIGKYNIINSIVPKTDSNDGAGTIWLTRYGNNNGDFYTVNDDLTSYKDSPSDFIDDFSATFSINMSASLGNGVTTAPGKITYTKAYLFNNRDDLFSAIDLTGGDEFDKDTDSAFLISWSLQVPL